MVRTASWRHAWASVPGTSHIRAGTACQDHAMVSPLAPDGTSGILLAVAADGAGSAHRSAEGARRVCRAFLDYAGLAPMGFDDPGSIDDGFPRRLLAWLRGEVEALAKLEGQPARAYACTLLAALVGEDSAIFLQLGDGACVFRTEEDPRWRLAARPSRGEFANETVFVTHADAALHLTMRRVSGRVAEFALMTDGVEFLAVQQARGEPHTPFLNHVLNGLRRAPPGAVPGHADWLRDFLSSDAVCRRTDDDKTMALASRAFPT